MSKQKTIIMWLLTVAEIISGIFIFIGAVMLNLDMFMIGLFSEVALVAAYMIDNLLASLGLEVALISDPKKKRKRGKKKRP